MRRCGWRDYIWWVMQGTILQVSVSSGGVPKRAIAEGVVTFSSVEGDSWNHPEYHGGAEQAVLLVAGEVLDELRTEGYPVFPGALGENLTTQGIDRRRFRSGQRFRAGYAVIELTRLREPCPTLNVYNVGALPPIQQRIYDSLVKAGDPSSPNWAKAGFYAKVIIPGRVCPGDIIALVEEPA